MTVIERPTTATVLEDAASALFRQDQLRAEQRALDAELRALCRQFDEAEGTRGCAPHHLLQACKARGLL